LNDRGVAAYKSDDGIMLQEESQNGKKFGKPVSVSPQSYLDLHDEWANGCATGQDATITRRALDFVRGRN